MNTIYDRLNSQQKQGVFTTEGPVLLLAGAGSGKTGVITHRIAYLIDEKGVNSYNILAITFTNKAAREMRQRVDDLVGFGAEAAWIMTFHAACVRILRRFIDRIGYATNFTIYDTDDQKNIMKDVIKSLELDSKVYKERAILSEISRAKDELITPDEMYVHSTDYYSRNIASAYREYQERLKKNNALDFDDIINKTIELFTQDREVLEQYQERFRYIMVDEYQDTNTAQFKLISLLAGKYHNICVVGDDDQSIYKFRGANIMNILKFEEYFPETVTIKLEQNYRSTGTILEAANAVIGNNEGRKGKKLWTESGEGEKIVFNHCQTGYEEALLIANTVKGLLRDGYNYKDFAVLYRTNAQSRIIEEKFVENNVPYKLYGGVNFYGRKEIKDVLAYLKTIDNARDDLQVKRILNVPKRGIGAASVNKIQTYADSQDISFYEALKKAAEIPGLGKAAAKIAPFAELIGKYHRELDSMSIRELIEALVRDTGYIEFLEESDEPETVEERKQNIDELISKAVGYEETTDQPTLGGFLEEVSLVADIDDMNRNDDVVTVMTLHSAKGLEFPVVFLAGLEEGIFPGYMSISSGSQDDIEEERRLCYVGITRAMKRLFLSAAKLRVIRGEQMMNRVSRFVTEIPDTLLIRSGMKNEGRPAYTQKKTDYQKPTAYIRKPYSTAMSSTPVKADALNYSVGDTVKHVKFGTGIVKEIKSGGRDYEVTVEFEDFGVKKMFASFAKLQKV